MWWTGHPVTFQVPPQTFSVVRRLIQNAATEVLIFFILVLVYLIRCSASADGGQHNTAQACVCMKAGVLEQVQRKAELQLASFFFFLSPRLIKMLDGWLWERSDDSRESSSLSPPFCCLSPELWRFCVFFLLLGEKNDRKGSRFGRA